MKMWIAFALAILALGLVNDRPTQQNGGCFEDAVRTWAGECIALDDLEVRK